MPPVPAGERDLQALSRRFARAEAQVLELLALAAEGDRRTATSSALRTLAALRALDLRAPVVTAYLHEHPKGQPGAVRDLAGSLAQRLDHAARTTMDGVRQTFTTVDPDTLDDLAPVAVLAAVDRRGVRWTLGRWADMNTATIGRQATSRGITDSEGHGRTVTINTGDCDWCASHAGDATIGTDALPPFHPNCSCTVTRA